MNKIFLIALILLFITLGNCSENRWFEAIPYLDDTTWFKDSKTRIVANADKAALPLDTFMFLRTIYDLLRWPDKEYIMKNSLEWSEKTGIYYFAQMPRTKRLGPIDTTIDQAFHNSLSDLKTLLKEGFVPEHAKKYFVPLDGAMQSPLNQMFEMKKEKRDSLIRTWDFPKDLPASAGIDGFVTRYKINDYLFQCYLTINRIYITITNRNWKIPLKQLTKEIVVSLLIKVINFQSNPESLEWSVIRPWPNGSIFLHAYDIIRKPYPSAEYSHEIYIWFDGEVLQVWWQRQPYPWGSMELVPVPPYSSGPPKQWLKK